MNKLIFLAVASILFVSCEQEIKLSPSEIPSGASTFLAERYPDAKEVSWKAEKENDHFYFEACFQSGNEKKEVHFDANGQFVEEEKE